MRRQYRPPTLASSCAFQAPIAMEDAAAWAILTSGTGCSWVPRNASTCACRLRAAPPSLCSDRGRAAGAGEVLTSPYADRARKGSAMILISCFRCHRPAQCRCHRRRCHHLARLHLLCCRRSHRLPLRLRCTRCLLTRLHLRRSRHLSRRLSHHRCRHRCQSRRRSRHHHRHRRRLRRLGRLSRLRHLRHRCRRRCLCCLLHLIHRLCRSQIRRLRSCRRLAWSCACRRGA